MGPRSLVGSLEDSWVKPALRLWPYDARMGRRPHNYGNSVFAIYICDKTLKYVFAGVIVLAEVPVKQVDCVDLFSAPRCLVLCGGRRIRVFGIGFTTVAYLAKDLSAMNNDSLAGAGAGAAD